MGNAHPTFLAIFYDILELVQVYNYRAGDVIELKSINLTFSIEQIYRGITFDRSEELQKIDII